MGKLFAVVVTLIALASAAIFALHLWWVPPDISTHGSRIDRQLNETMVVAGVLFVGAQLALAFFVWRFSASGTARPTKSFPGGPTPMVVLATVLVGAVVPLTLDAAGHDRVQHHRSTSGLDPRSPNRLAGIRSGPCSTAIHADEQSSRLDPGIQATSDPRIRDDHQHVFSSRQTVARRHPSGPAVRRAENPACPTAGVHRLRVARVDGQRGEVARHSQAEDGEPAIHRFEQPGAAEVSSQVEDVRVPRIHRDRTQWGGAGL